MNKHKYIDCIGYFLFAVSLAAMVFLMFNQVDFAKSMMMLRPFFWFLTFYYSMAFYYYWHLEENQSKNDEEMRGDALKRKKIYRMYGIFFGTLLLVSILAG